MVQVRASSQWRTAQSHSRGELHHAARRARREELQAKVKAVAIDNAELAARLDHVFKRLRELAVPGGPG